MIPASLKELIEFFEKNGSILKRSPLVFIGTLVLAFCLAFVCVSWRYQGLVENQKSIIETKEERIQAKEDQLNDYRERLHLISESGTIYSRMTNDELKKKTFMLVSNIRDFLEKTEAESSKIFAQDNYQYEQQMNKAKTEEERKQAWDLFVYNRMKSGSDSGSYFTRNFKTDSILLRDEMLSRLPKGSKNDEAYFLYENPINTICMTMVTDDLERLAKSLP
jgi:hypothetical protein